MPTTEILPIAYFNAQVVEIDTDAEGSNYIVFEYQGERVRVETFAGGAGFLAGNIGQVGAVQLAEDSGIYRFTAYHDQSLRRAPELDDFVMAHREQQTRHVQFGWRNDANPTGFLAPIGIIPGENGFFIPDSTDPLTLDVPSEFVDLCTQFRATPVEVLRGFIADAADLKNFMAAPRADGYSSNGSDERTMAYDYIQRAYGMRVEGE